MIILKKLSIVVLMVIIINYSSLPLIELYSSCKYKEICLYDKHCFQVNPNLIPSVISEDNTSYAYGILDMSYFHNFNPDLLSSLYKKQCWAYNNFKTN